MDNLLMIAFRDLEDEYSGITRKVLAQYNAFAHEYNVVLVGRSGNNILIMRKGGRENISASRLNRFSICMDVCKDVIAKENIKYIYFRRQPCNLNLIKFLKDAKNRGVKKIIWEIPTYPYDSENTSFAGKVRRSIDKIYRKQLKNYVSRIVTFAPDKEIFGVKTINTGNGIEVDTIKERTIDEHGDEIHLVAAAVLRDWHGYDRLIQGIGNYKGSRKVVFHLIGDGPCLAQYKQMVIDLGIEDCVKFYGYMKKEDMDQIYDKCDMAVESLGWHRSGVEVGTSIKTREYVAKGLPILASSKMDIFIDGWEYAYYAPIDDSPIDIYGLIDFYDRLYVNKNKKELATEIRKIAYEKCEMSSMMKPIIDYYNESEI